MNSVHGIILCVNVKIYGILEVFPGLKLLVFMFSITKMHIIFLSQTLVIGQTHLGPPLYIYIVCHHSDLFIKCLNAGQLCSREYKKFNRVNPCFIEY